MAPIWFDSDNFWRLKGATILASGGGSINTRFDIPMASVTIPWSNTMHLYCGAGAVNGVLTPSGDPNIGYEPPMVRITAGKYDSSLPDGKSAILGRFGLEPYDVIASETGVCSLQNDDSEPWIGGYPDPVSGYPPIADLQYLSVAIDFRKDYWSDGRPVFVGDWYVELYLYDDTANAPDPGNGDEDPRAPITCPVRPPWPYREPIRMVSAPDSAQIRRSRP